MSGTPSNSDVGDHAVELTATDSNDATVIQSFTITVANVNDPPSGSLTITGTLRQGEELTAVTTGISDDDGLGDFSYQWKRDGTDISGETSSTYTLVQADVGNKISVTVTYTDNQETVESLTSTETSAVLNKEPFKPKTKTELQTAIDTWYEFANGSAGTTRTSETSNETDKKSKFYLSNEPNDEGISLDIKGKLDSDEYLNATKGITKENLVKVEIGTDVESIGAVAFYRCAALTTVTIPDSVTTIGSDAFVHSGLKTLYMSENNGLNLKEGEQKVSGKEKVNVVFIPSNPNNYDGSEYYGNPNTWDTSLITDLSFLFFKKDQDKHPDIRTWDVSKVTNMQGTFSNSTFNGELNDWNVASVKDFSYCFANNIEFNQELKRWNVQDATTMKYMFDNAYSFNKKIEPPMVQYKDATKTFPTQLTWNETTINDYLETIYGSAAPQTNPTTFKGVFGMIALLKKTFLDNIPDDPADGGNFNTIKASFSEVMSELITNQQEILKYNYTYDEETWTKTDPSIYFENTDGKPVIDLNDAKDSLNQLRLNTIVDGMLLINKAYDIAKDLGEDYSSLIEKMKSIYDNVYAGLPFYIAWYAPLLETKENFLNNALTFHNGVTDGIINNNLTSFIETKPIRSINDIDYDNTQKQEIVESSSYVLYKNFKTAYKQSE